MSKKSQFNKIMAIQFNVARHSKNELKKSIIRAIFRVVKLRRFAEKVDKVISINDLDIGSLTVSDKL